MPRVKKKYRNGGVTPKKDDKLRQGKERSYSDYGADFLRALSQPLNYAREIGEGNFLPNQAELEAKGISPMESVIALANPADHIYAALAMEGIIDDPNYKKEDGMTYGTPGLLGLVAGTAAKKTSDALEGAFNLSKAARRPSNIYNPTTNLPRGAQNITGDVVMAPKDVEEGVEFTRRFYGDPQTQQALRKQYFPGGYSVDEARDAASKLDVIDRVRSDALGKLAGESGLIDGKTWEKTIKEGLEGTGLTMDDFYRAYPNRPIDGIYRVDAYGPDFGNLPEGTELEFMFQRGSSAPRMQLDPVRADDAMGIYDYRNDQIIGNPDVIRFTEAQGQRRLGAHEAGHYGSFRTIVDPASKLGKSYRKNLSDITRPEVQPYISGDLHWSQVKAMPNATKAQKDYAYFSDPAEIAARAIELRQAMTEILSTPKYSSLSKDSMRDVLMGDFSSIGGSKGFQDLISDIKSKNIELPEEEFFNIFVGAGNGSSGFDKKKIDSISKLLKSSFVIGGAAAGYGAMQNEGQSSNSMYAGGRIRVKKKAQGGMKVKKDPPKGYKRDADGYLTPVDFNEFHEMPSDSLNIDAIKKGISMAESLGGVLMMNPHSTATGMYGQRYSEIKDLPFMKGISREQFAQSPELQERVFDMRMEKGIGGPSLRRNAMELTEEYAPQLGDAWNFSLDDVAFLSNFLGRQRTREYFASLRDGTDFKVPGINKTPEEYLKIARAAAYKDLYAGGGLIKLRKSRFY